jgi:type IV secretory pathway VirB2 component (pilin)
MKASTLLVTIALASTTYACDSTVPADESRLSAQRGEASPARPMTTSPMAAARVTGNMAELSGAVAGVATDAMSAESPPPTGSDPLQNIRIGSAAPTMVIRTGQAFIEVEKVDPAALKVRQMAAQVGGFITNSSISGGRDQIRQATFELKIPASRYDQAADMLSTIGKVETVTSTAQDVGEEFVDVTARVTNSRRLEERLISLLANRTGKLDEVLRVERELARVREEIERYEGRLRYLSARIALSTLTITIHEPAPILGNSPGENPIAAALRRAWKNFIAVVAGSIAALGVVIPLVFLGLAAWLGYRRWKRR